MDNLARLMAILKGLSIDQLRLMLHFAEWLAEKGEEIKYEAAKGSTVLLSVDSIPNLYA